MTLLILKVTLQLFKGGMGALGLPAAVKLVLFQHPAQCLLVLRKGDTTASFSPWAVSDGRWNWCPPSETKAWKCSSGREREEREKGLK